MKIFVTAGATLVPIDQVRAITNIFKGKTGTDIATFMARKGARVTLVTSSPKLAPSLSSLTVISYKTYDDLAVIMEQQITNEAFDAVIHSAAVSDYQVSGVMHQQKKGKLIRLDASRKVSSSHDKLYLELSPTEKLIDRIREPWGFKGRLVKFKLEVGRSRDELVSIAVASVHASRADLIVANCLEWYTQSALLVNPDGSSLEVERSALARELWRRIQ